MALTYAPWCAPVGKTDSQVIASPDPYFKAPVVTGLENAFRARTYQRTMLDVKRAIDDARREGFAVFQT